MSDARLRELERRFKESGSEGDEAAWILERVRAGELTQEQLEVIASLEYPAAILSLELSETPAEQSAEDLMDSLFPFGVDAVRRAALAVAHFVLSYFTEESPDDTRPADALYALEEYLLCPCSQHDHLTRITYTASATASYEVIDTNADLAASTAAYAVSSAYNIDGAIHAVSCACRITGELALDTEKGLQAIKDAIAAELIPWALGYSDPVQERVEARRANNDPPPD